MRSRQAISTTGSDAHGYRVKPHGQLVRVSSRPDGPCTSRLSTSCSQGTKSPAARPYAGTLGHEPSGGGVLFAGPLYGGGQRSSQVRVVLASRPETSAITDMVSVTL